MTGAGDDRSKKGSSKPQGSLLLDDQLCFALYAASRAVTHLYRPMLDDLGLTYPQYLVMMLLWERGEMTVKDLAEALSLDYGTLSPMLKRLASAGLIDRQRQSDDERVVHIALTDAGRALKERAGRVCQVIFDSYGLDARELSELRSTLHGIVDSIARADLGSSPPGD